MAINDAYNFTLNTPLTVSAPGVLGNDFDADGHALTAVQVSAPTRGTLVLNPDGSFNYTPPGDYSGPEVFTYQASDGFGSSAVATVTLAGVGGVLPAVSFANTAAISIPALGTAAPYPSIINVSDLPGTVSKVQVTLNRLTHTYPDDLDMLLVGPGGQRVLLMSDVGGSPDVNNVTLTFADAASGSLPDSSQITSGTFKPTNVGSGDTFAAPAPAGPYSASLSTFNGSLPNGAWSLYVVDDLAKDQGSVTSGWSLSINSTGNSPPTISAIANQTTTVNTPTPTIALTVSDLETASANLFVAAQSSNPALLPDANIALGGSSANRNVVLTPLAEQVGTTTITLTVADDGGATATASFQLTVSPVLNNPPTISAIADQTTAANTPTPPIPFTVGDAETAAASLLVSAQSSNPTLLPEAGIALGGSGANRNVALTPLAGQSGTTTITLTVADGGGATTTTGFQLAVSPVLNAPPTISAIANQTTAVNTTTPPIAFTVGDTETPADGLTVFAQSSNSTLLPNANISLGGSGTSRNVVLTPVAGQSGTTTITVTVLDGGGATASTSFQLTVAAASDTVSFTNPTAITIPVSGAASPYPSVINVSRMVGTVSKVAVTFHRLTHTLPDDLNMLVVSPDGQKVLVMSDVGGGADVSNITLTLDDTAATSLPDSTQLTSGTFKPTNVGGNDVFAAPAPAAPYSALLSAFNGSSPNGAWAMYLVDDGATDQGTIADGWSLTITVGAPPSSVVNDNFAAAQTITGSSGTATVNTTSATKETGEPNHAGNAGGASVWYRWTAPSSSPATFDTALSGFGTLLAVYTGSAVNNLTLIAANDNLNANSTRSRLKFTPVAGTVYMIAVDGDNGGAGNLSLRWIQASTLLPDMAVLGSAVNARIATQTFAANSCAVLEGLVQAGTRRLIRFDSQTINQGATDLYFGNPANNPLFVWAPCHAHYHLNNYMEYRLRDSQGQLAALGLKVGFCILDVFRWDPNSAAASKYTCSNQGIQAGWGDLYGSTLDGQWIDITGLPNGNYVLELDVNPLGIVQESDYSNNLAQVSIAVGDATAPPSNDSFSSPQTLLGGFSSVPGVTLNATKQSGEPDHAANSGGHSIWYQWTALETKAVTIDTLGSSFNTLLAVYTGNTLGALSLVASNDDIGPGQSQSRVTFSATAGTVYKIAVDGFNGDAGNSTLTLNQTIQNDAFAAAEFIGGPAGVAFGSNFGASRETGEPNHAGNAGAASIWYAWTAPISGVAVFDTAGSTFNTLLAAYTGTSLNSLTAVASNDDADPQNGDVTSRIQFNAVGLTRYYLAIDGRDAALGDSTLNWNLMAGGSKLLLAGKSPAQKIAEITAASRRALTQTVVDEGALQLSVTGLPLDRYLIERSCDLIHWLPVVVTVADPSGHAQFTDKSTVHPDRQSSAGDPVCGPEPLTGAAFPSGEKIFYRATALGPN